MDTSVVSLDNISKGFTDGDKFHRVLDDIELKLNHADTIALTGPSGSGKSTLLNIIAGFEPPTSGSLSILGQVTKSWKDTDWSQFRHQQLGVVFQQFNLLTPLNVEDNIAFPLHLNGDSWNSWCDHLVDTLGLRALLKRHVETLSGGQQQRVAIARALAHKPALLLADEPTGNLDQTTSLEVMGLICALAAEHDTSILMVTHSQECADFMHRRWHLDLGKIHE
ncbi:ABC transporter ATP-binding protein [Shewanella psychrotolerans]|uniref:ABC transporter ATP-binding protein n=1 Tax=Shewanella psychrotolerans TaxID=2864206 RepID=UPI001C65586D|nr:ABC transporter ATP-binding protein [Shewanella psychrotolerans]QYK00920.1 ABC transporter ATP-binding protein [Shewanella psychrotolerans]